MHVLNHSCKEFLSLTCAQHRSQTKVIWVDDGPLLTLPTMYISKSCIELKIMLTFYFHTFFKVPQKVL